MIIFHETERLVTSQDWYEAGGYRANIVAYSIAKLSYDLREENKNIDFSLIWNNQAITTGLRQALATVAKDVDGIIRTPSRTGQNITEWAKQQACWNRVSGLKIDWPESLEDCLLSTNQEKEYRRSAKKDQKMVDGIQAQTSIVKAGKAFWDQVALWAIDRKLLTSTEMDLLTLISHERILSEKQSILLLNTLQRLQNEGCPHFLDVAETEKLTIQLTDV